MATAHQKRMYELHKRVSKRMGLGQSTLKHRSLAGSKSTPSSTGVVTYTPPMATAVDEATTDTLIWAIWQQKIPKTNPMDDILPGKTMYVEFVARFPAIDDNGNLIVVADEDWLVDVAGNRYKMQNPGIDQGNGYWTAQLERLR